MKSLFSFSIALAAFATATFAALPPAPQQEPPAELLQQYRAKTDSELRSALNSVSDQLNQSFHAVRDQEKSLAFAIRNGDYHSEEVDAAREKVESLRRAVSQAEQELQAAVLALPEMQERSKALSDSQEKTNALRLERAAIRHIMAERRPNKGPRPGAVLPDSSSSTAPQQNP